MGTVTAMHARRLSDDCVFCAIAQHAAPARIVYETPDVLGFVPLNPATTGHTLVIPRWHVVDFVDADDATLSLVAAAAATLGRAIREAVCPEGVNLITSAGAAATQTIFHLHLHVVPRWSGDGMGDIWPPKADTPAEHLDDVAARIRAACEVRR